MIIESQTFAEAKYNTRTQTYRIIKEYPRYYLCERICNGKALYRECISKVEFHVKSTGFGTKYYMRSEDE